MQGRLVWRYTLTNLDVGFPKDISEVFSGFPADVARVKGVFEISGNGETYFFSGKQQQYGAIGLAKDDEN